MQILPPTSAASAAGSVSQATSRDRTQGASESTAVTRNSSIENVHRAEQSSADRDAQGGGEGLDPRLAKNRRPAHETKPTTASTHDSLPVRSDEPPSEIDLVG